MRWSILTNTEIKKVWLDELKSYVDADILITETKDKLPTKLNPYFNKIWGDFDWIREQIEDGEVKAFVTTRNDLIKSGIKGHLGMYDMHDNESSLDFYIGLPDKLDAKAKLNGFKSNFAWLMVHEYLHGKEKGVDRVHEMEKQGRLKELLMENNNKDVLLKKKNALELIVEALKRNLAKSKQTGLLHPVETYRDYISQGYGVANSQWYPQTGHHIGTDYACPVGTKVKAPFAGEVTTAGTSASLGNYCIYTYIYEGVTYAARFLHLSFVPERGKYQRGEEIATTGNTGKSTGAHLHIDIFFNEVRVDILTKTNWRNLTVNPETHYAV